jgi:hypothetical protein
MKFNYKALQIRQTTSDKMIALFAAPATEVDNWAGIPQKKRFGTGEETVGFQREENPKRIDSLSDFCANDENIIQNPLLCSTRRVTVATIHFEANPGETGDVQEGIITIDIPDYDSFSLEQIFSLVRGYIEGRVRELATIPLDERLITRLKSLAVEQGHFPSMDESDEVSDSEVLSSQFTNGETSEVEAEAVLFEESHIVDFWQEIACRHEVIKLMENPPSSEEFLGFTRSALLSYLRPIVLVDGQHRLRGALKAAEDKLHQEDIQREIEERIVAGEFPQNVQDDILRREVRRLPISLLLADDPAEQVFQFVVVNQKATPIGRALLGTIVSTTLSNEEMEKVASRLKDAGIPLEESQAITYLARYTGSPFYGLVERGLTGDSKELLQWGVFVSLIGIFRDLRGGKLFHAKNDYAEIWKTKFLNNSNIISGYADAGHENAFDYWRRLDGPWRDVFMAFFSKIRDEFGDTKIHDSHNFWGRPRESNLFNKISLTILAADFFQYLVDTRQTIEGANKVYDLIDDWLDGVSRSYFNRDWNLSGVKKDSTGIRNQWSYQWNEYRKNPTQLPQARVYRNPKGD